jgi:hypothetical protein
MDFTVWLGAKVLKIQKSAVLGGLYSVAFDNYGNIFTIEAFGKRVQKFSLMKKTNDR